MDDITTYAETPLAALHNPQIVRALAVGSPDLLDALRRTTLSAKDSTRAELKLARYIVRMASRPTPYGAFAAVSLAKWGQRTTVGFGMEADHTRTRPDMGWLIGVLDDLKAKPEVQRERRWVKNPLLTMRDDRYVVPGTNGDRGSVRATPAVAEAVQVAEEPTPFTVLLDGLTARTGCDVAQAESLLRQLCRQGVLTSDLTPALTSPRPFDSIRELLRRGPSTQEVTEQLEDLLASMADFDHCPESAVESSLAEIQRSAAAIAHGAGPVIQTDLRRALDANEVQQSIADECVRAAHLLLSLSPSPDGSADLVEYTRAFIARFGDDREVPLLELLDPVLGLGPLGHRHETTQRGNALTDMAFTALCTGSTLIDLDQDTLSTLQTWKPERERVPVSLELSAFVVADDNEALNAGNFSVVIGPNLGGNEAGRSLGRFADLFGDEGMTSLTDIVAAEVAARPTEGIAAEVVYMPTNARSANVAIRPATTAWEILISGSPSVAPEHVLRPCDLVVSAVGGRLVLRVGRTGETVRPTARHMLNPHSAEPICRFLDTIGQGHLASFSAFDWGPASTFPRLPRIQHGRVVLSPARWLLSPAARLGQTWASEEKAFATQLEAFRNLWQMPARVYLTVGDNRLLLDLSQANDVRQLHREARSAGERGLVLQEALPDVSHAWVQGPRGQHVAELVVPMVLRSTGSGTPVTTNGESDRRAQHVADTPRSSPGHAARAPAPDRARAPGSDWLFVKLYGPTERQNELLRGPLRQLTAMSINSGIADSWFFIRYADPQPHLRIRWHGEPEILLRHLLPQVTELTAELADEGTIGHLSVDTYEREIERYGGVDAMMESELIFSADSEAVVGLLDAFAGSGSPDPLELAVLSIDTLLGDLGLNSEERLRWFDQQIRTADVATQKAAGAEYRNHASRLRSVLNEGITAFGPDIAAVLGERSRRVRPVAETVHSMIAHGRLSVAETSWLASHVHMHCNRLLTPPMATREGEILHVLRRVRHGLTQQLRESTN